MSASAISAPGEVDYYSIDLTAGTGYFVFVGGVSTGFGTLPDSHTDDTHAAPRISAETKGGVGPGAAPLRGTWAPPVIAACRRGA